MVSKHVFELYYFCGVDWDVIRFYLTAFIYVLKICIHGCFDGKIPGNGQNVVELFGNKKSNSE